MGINFPVFTSEMYLKRVHISTVLLLIWLVGMGVGMKVSNPKKISVEFISNFLKWQFPLKANIFTNVGQCFTLNFGSQINIEDLPMTTIDPYLVDQQIFQQNRTESDATNNCVLVFIGGKYLKDIAAVMEMLDSISENIGILPVAAFLLNTNMERDYRIPANSSFPLVICVTIPYFCPILWFKVYGFFKAYLRYKKQQGVGFKLQCPRNDDKAFKLILFNNGTVSKTISYEDICIKHFVNARVAYPTYGVFQVDNETNTMIEQDIYPIHGEFSKMVWTWEILKPLLLNRNILVTWIPCQTEYWDESGTLFKVIQFNVTIL